MEKLSQVGPLFQYFATVRSCDRATEFRQRCDGLGIKDISLNSYRYAWAERAKSRGYPERYAMAALGHNSKAVHRAYAQPSKCRAWKNTKDRQRHRVPPKLET